MTRLQPRPVGVITGAAGGIGSAIVRRLLGAGYQAIATDSSAEGLNVLARQCPAVQTVQCDLQDPADIHDLAALTIKHRALFFVHSAGYGGPFLPIDRLAFEDWRNVMDVNVTSVFLFLREVLPHLRSEGFGRVVVISSIQGTFGSAGSAAYVASKHALNGLVKTVAVEFGKYGVTVNAICPGYIQTPMGANDARMDEYTQRVLRRTPTHSMGTAEDVAELVEFVLRPSNGYLNGSFITLDGGISSDVGVLKGVEMEGEA